MFSPSNGDRLFARNVLLLMTDGDTSGSSGFHPLILDLAKEIRTSGIVVRTKIGRKLVINPGCLLKSSTLSKSFNIILRSLIWEPPRALFRLSKNIKRQLLQCKCQVSLFVL